MKDTVRVKPQACPNCGQVNDALTSLSNAKPKPGDLTVCIRCLVVHELDSNLCVKVLSPDDMATLSSSNLDTIAKIQATLRLSRLLGSPRTH
jgi:hypothetical protein